MAGITQEDMNGVKPFFRTLGLVMAVNDPLQSWRVNFGLTRVLSVMESQSRYIKVRGLMAAAIII